MKVVFLGSQEIGAACLEVILRQGHEVVGVGTFEPAPHENWTDDVARIARERGLPRLRGRRFKTQEAIEELKALRPDILFAIGWRWILPPEVLAIPPKGCLGIHGSLLPRLRGFAPVNWALIRDEKETGPTRFYFDEGMDTGDVVGRVRFRLRMKMMRGRCTRRLRRRRWRYLRTCYRTLRWELHRECRKIIRRRRMANNADRRRGESIGPGKRGVFSISSGD